MATQLKVLGLTLDQKLTYSTHIHNITVQAHNPLQVINALTATCWGKQKETVMTTYKAVMRPVLEFASSIWSPLSSSISINKLQVMQNAALRIATGCTQDTNIQHLHDETLILPIHDHLQLHASQYKQNTQYPSHTPYTNIQHTSTFNKPSIFNNGRYTTNISTDPHTITTTEQPCTIYIHLLSLCIKPQEVITKYCVHLHHTLAALKRYFQPHSSHPCQTHQKINHPSSNHINTKTTPNDIHHHYAPFVTLTQMTHIISSTAPTYAPHYHPWICGQTPPGDCTAGQLD